jgi:hypothetical protein
MPKKDEHAKILALVGIFPCKAFPERLFSSFFCRHSLFLRSNLFKSHALLERPHPRQLLKLSRPWMQYLWNLHWAILGGLRLADTTCSSGSDWPLHTSIELKVPYI